MFALFLIGLGLVVGNTIITPTIYDISSMESQLKLFESFQDDYSRNYETPQETAKRFNIFLNNVEKINKHNQLYPSISYTLDITRFTDWTDDEFAAFNNLQVLEFDVDYDDRYYKHHSDNYDYSALPTSIDWSTVKPAVVTPVKDQGSCGSCWAFGATGSWESRYAIKYGTLNSLSEQELIDCVPTNDCLLGGLSDDAFLYGIKNNGDSLESDYPYKGHDGKCTASEHTHYDALSSITLIARNNETAMMEALQSGPITVAVDAVGWGTYRSGVYNAICGTNLDHNVMVVGYGVDSTSNQKYWKVKNSWGSSWGMDGYILICRDCGKNGNQGECGINSTPSYPNIAGNNTYT